ncbi:histidine kinase [Tersicoccus solisilvae]|uniref:Histidine kinase n=1 Tax=Tersicoccus solisilvae TaxID=1882339 RepID=A0ABQ1P2M7_9MICC|nr:GAF domain-containing protein [Tersicoccus solisilvae]GGC89114.1 histidine kinase [Tersicoccus solisilvae]
MADRRLPLPDPQQSDLEALMGDLAERAKRVLSAQGRLRRLLEASLTVVEDLDLDQVLTRVVEAAVSLVDARYGALGVVGSDGRLDRFIPVGMSADEVSAIGRLPDGRGLLGAVIDSGSIIRLADLAQDSRSVGFPEHHPPMTAFLGVPIRVGERIWGNLYLTNKDGAFTDDDEDLVASLAVIAGIAIQNANLYEQTRRRQVLGHALSETTTALLSPDVTDVLDVVVRQAASVVTADLVTVAVPVRNSGDVRVDAAHGDDAALVRGLILPADESLAGRAIGTAGTVTSEDRHERTYLDGTLHLGPRLAVPLIVSGEAIGALCLGRCDTAAPFTAGEISLVEEFASQIALAVALAWARLDRERLEVVEERSRIARDLHDLVIQRLFVTGLALQGLSAAHPEVSDEVEAHIDQIDAAIADIRTAIFTLSNRTALSRTGIRHRLLDVVNDAASALPTAPRISFHGPLDLVVTGTLADDVVAVVRELLANVVRHAAARTVTVAIELIEGVLRVTVEDDGQGLPPIPRRASGTRHVEQRALQHGGTFVLGRGEPAGTRATWEVPIDGGPREVA